MGNGGCQTPDRSQAVLHAHFALQAADFGEIVEAVDESKIAAGAEIERRNHHAKRLAEPAGGTVANLRASAARVHVGQGILKEFSHRTPAQLHFGDLEQMLRRPIDQA